MHGTRIQRRAVLTSLFELCLVIGLALTLNYWSSRGFNALTIAFVSIAAAGALELFLLDRITFRPKADDLQLAEAVGRLGFTYRRLLDYYGSEQPEIGPPVLLRALDRKRAKEPSLEDFIATADQMANQVVIARLAESRSRCTVVIGEPGSGKSTMLLRLATHMIGDQVERRTREVPLVLSLSDWSGGRSLHRWVLDQAFATYAVPRSVVNYWVARGNSCLLLDGLDEVPPVRRPLLIDSLNAWVDRAGGTRLVVSCRSDEYANDLLSRLHADQLAILRPIPETQARGYVDSALSGLQRNLAHSDSESVDRVRRLLTELITSQEDLRAPSMLSLVAATQDPVDSTALGNLGPRNEQQSLLALANELLLRGDYQAARDAYLAFSRIPGSRHRSLSTVLYAACEALLGNDSAAREAMQESLAARLNESIQSISPDARAEKMSEDERSVLRVMSEGVDYDLSQLSSKALLTPSRVNAILTSLCVAGAVERGGGTDQEPRYRRVSPFVVGIE